MVNSTRRFWGVSFIGEDGLGIEATKILLCQRAKPGEKWQ